MRPLIALLIATVLVLACGGASGGYGSPPKAPPASGAPASGSSAPYDYGY